MGSYKDQFLSNHEWTGEIGNFAGVPVTVDGGPKPCPHNLGYSYYSKQQIHWGKWQVVQDQCGCIGGLDTLHWDPRPLVDKKTWRRMFDTVEIDEDFPTYSVRYRLTHMNGVEVRIYFSHHHMHEEFIVREMQRYANTMHPVDKWLFWNALTHTMPPKPPMHFNLKLSDVADAYKDLMQAAIPPAQPSKEPDGETIKSDLMNAIPGLKTFSTYCPVEGCAWGPEKSLPILLTGLIPHLNDSRHKWSREKIADWLETLEVDLSFTYPEEEGALA